MSGRQGELAWFVRWVCCEWHTVLILRPLLLSQAGRRSRWNNRRSSSKTWMRWGRCMVTLIDREGTISTERCIDIEKLWLVTQILVPLMSGPPESNTSTYWSMWNLQRNVFKSACQHIKKVLKLWKHAKVYTNTANKEFKCLKYLYFIALHIRMLQEPGFCWATYLSAACSMAFLQITCLCFYFHCILRESWFSYS